MWFKVKIGRDTVVNEKMKHVIETYLCDVDNFAEAGYKVLQYLNGEGEVEDVCLMKTLKPAGNIEYAPTNKVFIVKFAEDINIDGRTKTLKYPVPFYANNNEELQVILKLYLEQGLDNMRITTVSETQWKIIQ
jgi:hypothetical protein